MNSYCVERRYVTSSGNGLRSCCRLRPISFLCVCQNLSIDTEIHAANGKRVKALDIFAYALAFFKEQALKVKCIINAIFCIKFVFFLGDAVFLGGLLQQFAYGGIFLP